MVQIGVFETTLSRLEDKIKQGIWRPGERIPTLPNLSRELGVSISTLREVMRILENRGLLRIEQGRGTFVRMDISQTVQFEEDISSNTLKELFEARSILEPELAAMAARRAFVDEIEHIANIADQMSTLVQRRKNFVIEDLEFHASIARASHNSMLLKMYQSIHEVLTRSRHYTNVMPGMIEKAVRYHQMIVEALKNRDAERAYSLMKSHMNDVSFELDFGGREI